MTRTVMAVLCVLFVSTALAQDCSDCSKYSHTDADSAIACSLCESMGKCTFHAEKISGKDVYTCTQGGPPTPPTPSVTPKPTPSVTPKPGSAPTPSDAPTPTPADDSSSSGLTLPVIIAIAVGGAVLLAVVVFMALRFRSRSQYAAVNGAERV